MAAACGIHVLRLPENRGKGTAMRAGALTVQGDILLFLDAHLQGLTPAQVDDLIRPVLQGQADMSVGVFQQGRTATDLAQWISPSLSGQRCLSRAFFSCRAINRRESFRGWKSSSPRMHARVNYR